MSSATLFTLKVPLIEMECKDYCYNLYVLALHLNQGISL